LQLQVDDLIRICAKIAADQTVAMGRFNANKREQVRERKMKKEANSAKQHSTLKTRHQALTFLCQKCRAQFLPNTHVSVLEQHRESKHEKATFEECFPPQEKQAETTV